jgi:hypothetical protein
MIFDKQLCFVDGERLTAVASGVIGGVIDLGAPGQTGKGRPGYIAVACHEDTTATGSPVISLSLEFSEAAAFSSPVRVPLSTPPLSKADLAKGSVVTAPNPLFSLRYVRFYLTTSVTLTCLVPTIGFVLDPQTNI